MKTVAIVQARMGSQRLPGKVISLITTKPMIELLLSRLSKSKKIDEIMVAISEESGNDELESIILSLGYQCFRGSEKNVLNRYYNAAKKTKADIIVRITGDCPLVDAEIVDDCIDGFKNSKVDYFSNTKPRSFPDGLDVAVMSFQSIEKANSEAKTAFDKEHVTSYIVNSKDFSKESIEYSQD